MEPVCFPIFLFYMLIICVVIDANEEWSVRLWHSSFEPCSPMFCLFLVSTLQTNRNVEPHRLCWLNSTIRWVSSNGLNRRSQRNLSSIRDAQFYSIRPATYFLSKTRATVNSRTETNLPRQQNLEHIRNNRIVSNDVRNLTINYTDHYTIYKHYRKWDPWIDHSWCCSGSVTVYLSFRR